MWILFFRRSNGVHGGYASHEAHLVAPETLSEGVVAVGLEYHPEIETQDEALAYMIDTMESLDTTLYEDEEDLYTPGYAHEEGNPRG